MRECRLGGETCVDRDGDHYGVGGACLGLDCDDASPACTTDCSSLDGDDIADCRDTCFDVDRDGFGASGHENGGCSHPEFDADDGNALACIDSDADRCDDCSSGSFDPANDGNDSDGDGICNRKAILQHWYDASLAYRKRVTIPAGKVEADLAGFPVLLSFTDADLKASAQASASDVVFSAPDGVTAYASEIEQFDSSTGALVAWVRIPAIATATATEFFMYYGSADANQNRDSDAVWDDDYRAVWHLSTSPVGNDGGNTPLQGAILDSTANGNHGTANSTMTSGSLVAAKIGDGIRFDPAGNTIDFGSSQTLDNLGPLTFEAWLSAASCGGGSAGRIFTKTAADKLNPHSFSMSACNAASAKLSYKRYYDTAGSAKGYVLLTNVDAMSLNAWHHVVLQMDADTTPGILRVYIDGTAIATYETHDYGLITSNGSFVSDASYNFLLGNRGILDYGFDGIMDEVRLSAVIRSDAWIRASFTNQSEPAAFVAVGAQEPMPE